MAWPLQDGIAERDHIEFQNLSENYPVCLLVDMLFVGHLFIPKYMRGIVIIRPRSASLVPQTIHCRVSVNTGVEAMTAHGCEASTRIF